MAAQDEDQIDQQALALEGDALAPSASRPRRQKLSVDERRARILGAVHSFELETLEAKVASILNDYPDARDSDIALQLRYWQEHDGVDLDQSIAPTDLYSLTRLTQLARARATIQNTLGLFKASIEVQETRGTLKDEERAKVKRRRQSDAPVVSVYADETGKQKSRLIVASVWVLVPSRDLKAEWRSRRDRPREFHFAQMGRGDIAEYMAFTDVMLERSVALSFHCLSVPKPAGNPDDLLEEMCARLLLEGVHHELDTGRISLPRAIQFWKDQDDAARDALACARLRDRLDVASDEQFDSGLHTDTFEAVNSKTAVYIQFADLFAGSLNRVLNEPGCNHKDTFAEWFLRRVGYPLNELSVSDKVMHFALGSVPQGQA